MAYTDPLKERRKITIVCNIYNIYNVQTQNEHRCVTFTPHSFTLNESKEIIGYYTSALSKEHSSF